MSAHVSASASALCDELRGRGGDLAELRRLALGGGPLDAQLRALGFAKLGHRKKLELELRRAPPADAAGPSDEHERPRAAPATAGPSAAAAAMVRRERGDGERFGLGRESRGKGRLELDRTFAGLLQVQQEPPVFIVDGFLAAGECEALVRAASASLTPSETESGVSAQRTSWTTHLSWADAACGALRQRAERLTGLDHSRFEAPQVARYTSGQLYKPHLDSNEDWDLELGARTGPKISRIATVLVYLNDVASGGGTRFPYLELEVRPRMGAALVFFPSLLSGRVDHTTLHEALPAGDTKYVCQLWVQ